jgi:hypothetical protein
MVMKDRSHWVVQKCESFEEMERLHIRNWPRVSGPVRLAAAWEMVEEVWKLKNRNLDELRFQRLARCVKRGGS